MSTTTTTTTTKVTKTDSKGKSKGFFLALGVAAAIGVAAYAGERGKTANAASSDEQLAQASADVQFHEEYVKTIARTAYVWGYPMVNMMNRRERLGAAPEPGRLFGVLPASPTGQIGMLNDYIDPGQNFIACPNQDVVYGLGFQSLVDQPVVMQIPDFGDRFWVYAVYDQRTDQIGELGQQYGTEPGDYLLVGPNWDGETPDGIDGVVESSTDLAIVIPRIFMDDTDEDRAAIQPLINQVVVYPLSEYANEPRTKVWADAPSFGGAAKGGGETKWVVPETYFDQFGEVLATVPPLPGEESLYGQFTALMEAAERSPEIAQWMTDAAVELDDTLIQDFLRWEYNGKPAGNGWNRSLHNAEWGLDYFNRTGTSRSNMFDNRGAETQYFYTDYDSSREQLDGANTYSVTFAAGELPPVDGFWSLTLYNEHHFFYDNEQGRYSLGTKNKSLQYNEDGSLTIYAGHSSPGADKESNWIPAPDGPFSLYIRAYAGQKPIIDGSWVPPQIERH